MSILIDQFKYYIPPPLRMFPWRAHPLDGKLLLFERDSGLNMLLEGDETSHLKRLAPRTLLIAVTNHCNLACSFCYRDPTSTSNWTYDSLLEFCQQANRWGVLEVAFGGGEPSLFPRWQEIICELYDTTQLAVNFTTNGLLLDDDFLQAVKGKIGQIRLSLYENNRWEQTIQRLSKNVVRFGVNWLITRAELDELDSTFDKLLDLGVNDFLIISYKGDDPALHFRPTDYQRLERFILKAYDRLGEQVSLKLDSCWGNHLPAVPRLFSQDDCHAADDFISITSDKRMKPCSFHHLSAPFQTLAEVQAWWERNRRSRPPAHKGGCARLLNRGLTDTGE